METTAERPLSVERPLVLSASQLEAYDACPAAYRYAYVDRLPAPEADQRQLLLGSALHAVLEHYVRHCVARRIDGDVAALDAIALALWERGVVRHATASLYREAVAVVRPFLARWRVPWQSVVGIEHRVALTADGVLTDWHAPDALVRGVLDLVTIEGRTARVWDWKSAWVEVSEAEMATGWAPAIYAAAMWAWAPGLERVVVEYWYVRTGRSRRVDVSRDQAAEALGWVRAVARTLAEALADPDQERAWPARPGRACATCPWVGRCPAGRAVAEATDTPTIADEADARRVAGLLLAAEARAGRLREALQQYLRDREPLVVRDDLAIGWWPTRGTLPPEETVAALREAGITEVWDALRVDNLALARLVRGRPELAAALEALRRPSPPWWGHKRPPRDGRG